MHKELVVAFLLRLELEFSVGGFHCDHLTSLEAIAIVLSMGKVVKSTNVLPKPYEKVTFFVLLWLNRAFLDFKTMIIANSIRNKENGNDHLRNY